jgi:hypothetical protein
MVAPALAWEQTERAVLVVSPGMQSPAGIQVAVCMTRTAVRTYGLSPLEEQYHTCPRFKDLGRFYFVLDRPDKGGKETLQKSLSGFINASLIEMHLSAKNTLSPLLKFQLFTRICYA